MPKKGDTIIVDSVRFIYDGYGVWKKDIAQTSAVNQDGNYIGVATSNYQTDGTQKTQILVSDSPVVDAFGRLRVSNPETIFDSKNIYDDPNQAANAENQILFYDNQQISGTGTSTAYNNNTASQSISVSANTAGRRVRQTKQRFNYQPGKSLLIFKTFVFNATEPGITQRQGYFDDNNGIYLEDDGTGYSFTMRSYASGAAVDTKIVQANWNVDKLDGTGSSGIDIDLTKTNILIMDMEWLGVGRARVGFVVDGLIYYAHEFLNANNMTVVYMSKPNLPFRSEIINDGTGAAATLTSMCATAISEGGQEPLGVIRSVNTGGTALTATTEGTTYALLGVRLHPNYIAQVTRLMEATLQIQSATHKLLWDLRLDPVVAGTFTYNTLIQSGVQYAQGVSANTVTGGYIVNSGFLESGGQQAGAAGSANEGLRNSLNLGTLIDGTSDEFILCVTPIAGSSGVEVEGEITWRELL